MTSDLELPGVYLVESHFFRSALTCPTNHSELEFFDKAGTTPFRYLLGVS
jgi:hypothetical protein